VERRKGRQVNVTLVVRDSRGTTTKKECAEDTVYGRVMQVLNSKSDNTSDRKAITKDQYGVVWGSWLYIGME